jgi:hypothetical protein
MPPALGPITPPKQYTITNRCWRWQILHREFLAEQGDALAVERIQSASPDEQQRPQQEWRAQAALQQQRSYRSWSRRKVPTASCARTDRRAADGHLQYHIARHEHGDQQQRSPLIESRVQPEQR